MPVSKVSQRKFCFTSGMSDNREVNSIDRELLTGLVRAWDSREERQKVWVRAKERASAGVRHKTETPISLTRTGINRISD